MSNWRPSEPESLARTLLAGACLVAFAIAFYVLLAGAYAVSHNP